MFPFSSQPDPMENESMYFLISIGYINCGLSEN